MNWKKEDRVNPVPSLIAILILSCAFVAAPYSYALDPTELEPAEGMEGKVFELEQEIGLRNFDDYEAESETSLEYEFNRRSALKLTIPVEWEENEDTEAGVGLRYKFVMNPDADRAPIAAVSIETLVPVSGEDNGVDVEAGLYLSKAVGGNDGKHQLHLNVLGYFDNAAESDERDLRYTAIAGYSCQVTPKTSLVADVVREQLDDHKENANILELGTKHEFNETVAGAIGVGAGLGEDSPDFTVHAGISFRFGSKRQHG